MDAGEAGAIAALSALNSAALLQGPSRPAGEGGDAPKLSSELAVSNQPSMNVAETTVAETNHMNVVSANQLAAGLQQSHIYGLLLASALVTALLADFFFMPALVLRFEPFGPEGQGAGESKAEALAEAA